jgi:DNA polymerase III epsilon subunit-like protein
LELIVKVETTGLDPTVDKVCQLSCLNSLGQIIAFRNFSVPESWFVDPQYTGLTGEFLNTAMFRPYETFYWSPILVNTDVIISYNTEWELEFLKTNPTFTPKEGTKIVSVMELYKQKYNRRKKMPRYEVRWEIESNFSLHKAIDIIKLCRDEKLYQFEDQLDEYITF